MKVLIDTNVILDALLHREPMYTSADDIIKLCSQSEIEGFVAFHSIPTIFYILEKNHIPDNRKWLEAICKILDVVSVTKNKIIESINDIEFSDFEDSLQYKCAEAIGADYIITSNIKDYKNSKIKVITPIDFMKDRN